MFEGPFDESILKRARQRELLQIQIHNLRDYAEDKHRITDDRPFGGGPGMVLKPEPLVRCIEKLKSQSSSVFTETQDLPQAVARGVPHVVLLSPRGRKLTQSILQELAAFSHLILVCGHYEGVDERVRILAIDEEISIGDYILTNGALPAMVLVDGVARLVPGVLGHEDSAGDESFSHGLLEYPQYTRPAEFQGLKVPEILLSGNHQEVAKWRKQMSEEKTKLQRPDLLDGE